MLREPTGGRFTLYIQIILYVLFSPWVAGSNVQTPENWVKAVIKISVAAPAGGQFPKAGGGI